MPGYLIARVDVSDWLRYSEYMRHTPRVIAQFGGRFIVRGGEHITVEGPQETNRLVVIEFPSFEQAKAFYESAEYKRIKKFRDGAGHAQFVIVDGYAADEWTKAVTESSQVEAPE